MSFVVGSSIVTATTNVSLQEREGLHKKPTSFYWEHDRSRVPRPLALVLVHIMMLAHAAWHTVRQGMLELVTMRATWQ